jgi:hypothetical protein
MIKYFFMAVINATMGGRPVVQFNTVSSLNIPDLTAASISAIQEGAANMANAQGTQFDDLVIQNLFCLTPNGMTEEQFTAGTALAPQPEDEPQTDVAERVAQSVQDFQTQAQNATNEAVAEDLSRE